MRLSRFAIKHPAIITMLLISVLLFGMVALSGLKQEFLPAISLPELVITTVYPGASPEDVEKEITEPLEEVFNGIPGVSRIESSSAASLSVISIFFEWEIVPAEKIPDVREKINGVLGDLPEDISGSPAIYAASTNVLSAYACSIEGDMDPLELTKFVDDTVAPSFSRIPGVSRVDVSGGERKEVHIQVDPFQLQNMEISVLDLYEILEYNNASIPAGRILFQEGSLNLNAQGEFKSLNEIANTVVGLNNDSIVRIRDIATVEWAEEEHEAYNINGKKEQIVLNVFNQDDADVVDMINRIEDEIDQITKKTSGTVRFTTIANDASNIRLSLNSVLSSAILGTLLAVLILFLFLRNVRTSLIIGISIPISILFSLILLRIMNLSLNLMSMGALTLSLGMIVDSSIVLLENIYNHFLRTGDRIEAAKLGADEMGSAVIASTATSLAVFAPILFLTGLAGTILKDVALTMLFTLGSSMVVAIVVVPYLSIFFLKKPIQRKKRTGSKKLSLSRIVDKALLFADKFNAGYRRSLQWALGHKKTVFIGAGLIFLISIALVRFLNFEFIPSTDMNEIVIEMETPPGYTLEETREKAEEVEILVKQLIPETAALSTGVGYADFFGLRKQNNRAVFRIRLIGKTKRKRDVHTLMEILRKEIPYRVSDINAKVQGGGMDILISAAIGSPGYSIQLEGNDLEDLMKSAGQIEAMMYNNDKIQRVDRDVTYNRRELIMRFDHDVMGTLGITPREAALASRIFFTGIDAGTLYTDDGNFPIKLESTLYDREVDENMVNIISIRSQFSDETIPFGSFTTLNASPGISEIIRKDRIKAITVTGIYKQGMGRKASAEIEKAMDDIILPSGVERKISGSAAEIKSTFLSLLLATAISVFLVYAVMVIQFERFTQPLIIMIAVPFTFIGVILSLLFFRTSLNIVSILGIIALAGIVVNNAIVLVDYTNLLRKRDKLEISDAILESASSRLRPILMTTLTTILGILPLALNTGEGAEIYSPLGQSISGGLISSTLITLYLVPLLYHSFEKK